MPMVERQTLEDPEWELRALRMEIGALVFLHLGLLLLFGVTHTFTLYVGMLLGWLPPPANENERILFSPYGFMVCAATFLLFASVFFGLAWRLRVLARRDSAAAPMPE